MPRELSGIRALAGGGGRPLQPTVRSRCLQSTCPSITAGQDERIKIMRKYSRFAGLAIVGLVPTLALGPTAGAGGTGPSTIPFPDARLKIEYNSTDGDAGLQIFLDAPAWRQVSITNPSGLKVLDVEAERVIRNYGLTELFSESSEPPFDEFPFSEFKLLFPEGDYTFRGQTIDGERLKSTFTLTHMVPDGPEITSPLAGTTVAPDDLVVAWLPVNSPTGVNVVAYQVLVFANARSLGNPKRVFDVILPGNATQLPVAAEFLVPGGYKAEVLAIEASGNQTLTEVVFTIG